MNDKLLPGPRYKDGLLENIQIAYFDIDNTVVGNESPDLPSERFTQATKVANIAVAIASARPLQKVTHILEHIDADGINILCNGAQLYDNVQQKFVAEWTLSQQTTSKIIAILDHQQVIYWINDDGIDHFPKKLPSGETIYQKQENIWDRSSPLVVVDGYVPEKSLVIVADKLTKHQADDIQSQISAIDDSSVSSIIAHETKQDDGSYKYDMFISNTLANKKHALAQALKLQGFTYQQPMAVGDGRNDEVLVGSAGVGVAVKNAAKETLAVATHLAPHQEKDGAAVALEAVNEFSKKYR